ncbi:MAG: hypothetical protein ACE37B_01395 [Ilumatobacter sp.]|uniref:hypothetical protein n=1 Tax=Ilumatobacter sp. TaxID=1967498 RepID=UPI00391AAFBB
MPGLCATLRFMLWSVVEEFVEGKSVERACEDIIVVTSDFAAVIDGATDETGALFDGKSGGLVAAETLASTIEGLDQTSTAREFADELSGSLRRATGTTGDDVSAPDRWPSASLVCLSFARREVWRIGDCSFLVDGEPHLGTKRIDDAAYGFRAAINAALIAAGTSLDEIVRTDPGAGFARPLHDLQQQLSNLEGPWGFGCVNGRVVPDQFVEVFPVGPDVDEVVLASDGFPDLRPTLAASETRLRELLQVDPAAIAEIWSVGKALRPGANSVDDRAYLRLSSPQDWA